MARTEVKMPQLGETVTEGTITRWLKQVGEEVKADDLLFEVSTDKVDSEVPSPSAGYLAEILVPEGETVDVGTVLAVLSDSADEVQGGEEAPKEEAPAAEEPQPEAPAAEEPQPEPEREAEPAPEPEAPKAEEPAPPPAPEPGGDGDGHGDGIVLSPVVRRLLAEYSLDPSQVQGTGEGGRITRSDVLAHVEGKGRPAPAPAATQTQAAPKQEPAPAPEAGAPAPAPRPAATLSGESQTVPMSNIRRRTAEHMVRSKQTSPHVSMAIEVDFENVERVRQAHKDEWKAEEGFGLTYLPFIARAVCDALGEFPHVNSSVDGDNLVVHGTVNLGIAVDLDFEGLIVPVVKNADGLRLRHLAREIRTLADRARSKQLGPDEISGGTYTITNPGPFGTFVSAPIINQPQVAILSTEGIHKRPVVVETSEGDAIAVHHVGVLAQSWDHRAFDGAYNASFMKAVKEIIETRDWDAELA